MTEASGPEWCDRFPTSISLDDLQWKFAENTQGFINAIEQAGGTVSVSATYRPAERAYLMHWCCLIASGQAKPSAVPAMAGVAIDWTHAGTSAAAVAAARAMMTKYNIAYPAALISRHTQRRAIDMTIGWKGVLKIKDAHGVSHVIPAPCDGSNRALWEVGATFGVIKLASDPPHWSDDGH